MDFNVFFGRLERRQALWPLGQVSHLEGHAAAGQQPCRGSGRAAALSRPRFTSVLAIVKRCTRREGCSDVGTAAPDLKDTALEAHVEAS